MFLDTSGLASYLDRRDTRHSEAVALFRGAGVRLVHNYVLAEMVPLCQTRGVDRTVALGLARQLLDTRLVEVVWVDEPPHAQALALLRARPDK